MFNRNHTIAAATIAIATVAGLASPVAAQSGPTCDGQVATIVGTQDDDFIIGTDGPDVIVTLGGDDVIFGEGGDDIICSGQGDDFVYGGQGADRIFGQRGGDVIFGNAPVGADTPAEA